MEYPGKLIQRLQEKKNILKEIYALTRMHKVILSEDNFQGFLENLEKRKALIDKLKDADIFLKTKLNGDNRENSFYRESLEDNIKSIFREITLEDKRNSQILKNKMAELRKNIKRSNESKKVLAVYGKSDLGYDSPYNTWYPDSEVNERV